MRGWGWIKEYILLKGPHSVALRGARWRIAAASGYGWTFSRITSRPDDLSEAFVLWSVPLAIALIMLGEFKTIRAQDERYQPIEMKVIIGCLLFTFLMLIFICLGINIHTFGIDMSDVLIGAFLFFFFSRTLIITCIHYYDQWFGGKE